MRMIDTLSRSAPVAFCALAVVPALLLPGPPRAPRDLSRT